MSFCRRAKEHEKLANFAANFYKSIKTLRELSPLYVFSFEAYTEIYLQATLKSGDKITEDAEKKYETLNIKQAPLKRFKYSFFAG